VTPDDDHGSSGPRLLGDGRVGNHFIAATHADRTRADVLERALLCVLERPTE
jgi:hypothetical protein